MIYSRNIHPNGEPKEIIRRYNQIYFQHLHRLYNIFDEAEWRKENIFSILLKRVSLVVKTTHEYPFILSLIVCKVGTAQLCQLISFFIFLFLIFERDSPIGATNLHIQCSVFTIHSNTNTAQWKLYMLMLSTIHIIHKCSGRGRSDQIRNLKRNLPTSQKTQ